MVERTGIKKETAYAILVFRALVVLVLGVLVGYFVYTTTHDGNKYQFKLGLDLSGGSRLVYEADVSGIESTQVAGAMGVLRDVIETRINAFGVSEPVVQVEEGSIVGGGQHRLVVELPGVTDVDEATTAIGKTPLLEFKLGNPAATLEGLGVEVSTSDGSPVTATKKIGVGDRYIDTGLTGRYLEHATLQFEI